MQKKRVNCRNKTSLGQELVSILNLTRTPASCMQITKKVLFTLNEVPKSPSTYKDPKLSGFVCTILKLNVYFQDSKIVLFHNGRFKIKSCFAIFNFIFHISRQCLFWISIVFTLSNSQFQHPYHLYKLFKNVRYFAISHVTFDPIKNCKNLSKTWV